MLQFFFFEKRDSRDLISRLYDEFQGNDFLPYISRKYVLGALRECGLMEDERYIRVFKIDTKYQTDLKKIARPSSEFKIRLIQKAFRDSGIKGIFIEDEIKRTVIPFTFELAEHNNEIEKYLWEFDYDGLKKYMKRLECLSLEENLDRKQELIYGYYEIFWRCYCQGLWEWKRQIDYLRVIVLKGDWKKY